MQSVYRYMLLAGYIGCTTVVMVSAQHASPNKVRLEVGLQHDTLQSSQSDSLIDLSKRVDLLETLYAIEKKEKENAMLKMDLMEEREKSQRRLTIIVIGLILSVAGASLSFVLYYSQKNIRKKNILLSGQNAEITAATREIQAQHEEITVQSEELRLKNDFLEIKNKELEELNREKDSLIGIVAHDLRSPLNRTIGLAKILQGTSLNSEQQNLIRLMLQVNDEGVHLIKDILQVTSDENYLDRTARINLSHFIEETVSKLHRDSAGRKNITIYTGVDEELEILSDPVSLRRILDNLVSNAIKFSLPDTHIFLKVLSVEDAVYISVRDQGPGISEEDQRKLFRKFQRLSAQPTSGETSTGLGLAIVKGLVSKLNGEIKVKTELGQGSEFIVRLWKTQATLTGSNLPVVTQTMGN